MNCLNPIYKQQERVNVPCGRCLPCLKRRRGEWSFRLERELDNAFSASFLTLTYSSEEIPFTDTNTSLLKEDLQDFIKKCRYRNETEHQMDFKTTIAQARASIPQLRYYAVGEYGEKFSRPHYHIIIFNLTNKNTLDIQDIWDKGQVHVGRVTSASIAYTTKYVITKDNTNYSDRNPPFALMSRRPAIGSKYLMQNGEWHKKNEIFQTRMENGQLIPIPRYYKEKIFDKYQKKRYKLKFQNALAKAEVEYEQYLISKGLDLGKYQVEQTESMLNKINKQISKSDQL